MQVDIVIEAHKKCVNTKTKPQSCGKDIVLLNVECKLTSDCSYVDLALVMTQFRHGAQVSPWRALPRRCACSRATSNPDSMAVISVIECARLSEALKRPGRA